MTPSYWHGLSPSFRYARSYYLSIFDGAMAADVGGRPMVVEIKEEVSLGIRAASAGGSGRRGRTYVLVLRRTLHMLLSTYVVDISL